MKFLHLADLHFGKSIYGVSLLERGDQQAWVERFLALAGEVSPDAVVIAGDVYDRSVPSAEAVVLLDDLVTGLAEMDIPVLLVAGNHDSGQRLSFGGSLLAKQKIHISGMLSRTIPHVILCDRDGPVTFWLMPYVFPALVSQKLEDESIRDYDTAVRRLLAEQEIDFTRRNVLVAHQNVTANGKDPVRGGSESMVGGVGQVDHTAFDGFDYVALGHIHAAYPVGRDAVRYAGSPLCYHFDETRQAAKGPLLVELGPKGSAPVISKKIIAPLHPMRELRGEYAALRQTELQSASRGEYIRVVLTDRRPTPEIYLFFRELFEHRGSTLLELVSEYAPFGPALAGTAARTAREKPVEDLFMDFYADRFDGKTPDAQDQALLRFAAEQAYRIEPGDTEELRRQAGELLQFALDQEGAI